MNPYAIALFRDLADRSEAEREEYYSRHEVDAALRAEVESLLRFDRQTGNSLRDHVAAAARSVLTADFGPLTPAAEAGLAAARARIETVMPPSVARFGQSALRLVEEPGAWFGAYRLREPLGEGGMGVVWLAEQEQPIQRIVAIKVVKPDADSDRVLRRFESERQALAILNHPHIAKVFDAGTRPDGQPYSSWSTSMADPSPISRTSGD